MPMKYTLLASLLATVFSAQAAVPEVSPQAEQSAAQISADPIMQNILKEAMSPEGQKWRFNT